MTEQDNTDPRKPGEGATADSEWRGDAGDQGNDLRFGEEQQLIEEQSKANAPEDEQDSTDTSHGYTSHQDRHDSGEYTDRDKPHTEGEHGDSHGYTSHQDRHHPGNYTDHDEEDLDVGKDVASSSGKGDDGRPDSQESHSGDES